ncbi:GIY-YIG nuclease family protein [Enterococcus faecalis]|uniref:GIY-YIG nuclease family protein n=1 Tax=Enterococcus faecalis TaxID=1351 RepID=UPI00192594D9|nr:GIY-YIG nuclease family protein [Enterococcus faecalis]MDN3139606.1 GIY-YIG nuclease family protein [Enterococcus faecalis]
MDKTIIIYVLRLEKERFYIGYTTNLKKTLNKIQREKGSQWVRKNKFIDIVEIQETIGLNKEQIYLRIKETTRKYMEKHGISNVRSSIFSVTDEEKHLENVRKFYYKDENENLIDIEKVLTGNWQLYCLQLKNDRYYIGISKNPYRRFWEHKKGEKKGALFTKKYPPKNLVFIQDLGRANEFDYIKMETQATLNAMKKIGCYKVRGGELCFLEDVKQYEHWRNLLKNNKNKHVFPIEWMNYSFEEFMCSIPNGKISNIRDILH